jgi:hypothetical protein
MLIISPIPKMLTFDASLAGFLTRAQAMLDKHAEDNGFTFKDTLTVDPRGKKYIRIVSSGTQESVFTFVEKETGNIFSPAGWKAPKTKRANGMPDIRGNIFAEDYGISAINPYGTNTIR